MADYTATTDMTLETAISNGPMTDGDNLTINRGVTVTCTQTPSVLIGNVNTFGTYFIDGENIATGNMINHVGEYLGGINVRGTGTFKTRGDWYTIGTTNGTNSQTFNLATYYDGSFCVDVVPMIQVETGRRIDYDGASGVDPQVDDMLYKTSDLSVMGKIVEVNTTSSYVVVRWLTGTLANNDGIEVRRVINDGDGPNYEITWTADVNNASGDIKEAGIYQEFANTRADGVSRISGYHLGVGGFVFDNDFQSTTLTMGSAASTTGGFVPPSGCTVRVPNVHFSTSRTTEYASNQTYNDGGTSANNWDLTTTSAGTIDFQVCNLGSAYFESSNAFAIDCSFMGFWDRFGATNTASKTTYTNCVCCSNPFNNTSQVYIFATQDQTSGADITNCMLVRSLRENISLSAQQSVGVTMKGCIVSLPGVAAGASTSSNYGIYTANCQDVLIEDCIVVQGNYTGVDQLVYDTTSTNWVCKNLIMCPSNDETAATEERSMFLLINTKDFEITGLSFIGDSMTGDALIRCTDALGGKIRCFGMIDEKPDFGTDGEELVEFNGIAGDIEVARMWKQNGEIEEAVILSSASKDVRVYNCGGEYASEFEPGGVDNIQFRGVQAASGNIGSTTGISVGYAARYGNPFHDGFRSDTVGYICAINIAPSATINPWTITSGTPEFEKDGSIDLVSGDVLEVEQTYFAKGHTGFDGNYTSARGSATWGANEWTNITVDFQYDINDGNGWNGTWLNARTPANLTGISVDPGDGVKVKFRYTCTADQPDLSMFILHTTTSIATQKANLIPIDQNLVTVSVNVKDATDSSNIQNARVLLEAAAGGDLTEGTDILSGTTDASGTLQDTEFLYTNDQPVIGRVRRATTGTLYKTLNVSGTITTSGLQINGFMVRDE